LHSPSAVDRIHGAAATRPRLNVVPAQMSLALAALFSVIVLATSFLSGVFGMAGGMVLMGVLIFMMPVSTAMVLHGVTQLASNGWRVALWWRYVKPSIVVRFAFGTLIAFAVFSAIRIVPDRATVLLLLGLLPFIAVFVPDRIAPRADRIGGAELGGLLAGAFQLLAGVSGPLLDTFFVRMGVDRRAVVATKAACQMISHVVKLVYFGGIAAAESDLPPIWLFVLAAALAIAGTSLARQVLERLTDAQFRRWTKVLVMGIGLVYLVQGTIELLK